MRLVMTSLAGAGTAVEAQRAALQLQLRLSGRILFGDASGVDLEPKDALLLAYLALEGPTARARLASLLWPDVEDSRALGNLRQRLLRLRHATGTELVLGRPLARLAPGVEHDLHDGYELLAGLGEHGASGLGEWLAQQRERRRRTHAARLAAAAAQAEAEGELATALEHALTLVALDPLSEQAHRRVMKLHYLRGDVAAAIAAYERCRNTLRQELSAAPSKETEALRASLGTALIPAAPAPAERSVPLSVLRPPRLIGRDAEWDALQRAWDEAQPVFVLGDAGMGKTRLVSDFARAHGQMVVVNARPGDERVVYAGISRLLRQLPRERLAALDAGIRKELARLLPEFGDAEPIRSDAERTRFFNAVAAALQTQGVDLGGVIVDDLHFADEASVELIQYLLGTVPTRWTFAARAAELGATARALLGSLRDRTASGIVELGPLSPRQIAALVESLDLPGVDAAAMAPQLARHAGGNPLFVLETLKAWLMQTGPQAAAHLPTVTHVGALIERRIGQLSAEAIRLARCAAVAGQDFSVELGAHVLGVRPLDLADAWAELEAAHVFRDGAFAHDLIYEAALASVPPPIARELHGQIARYLAERDAPPGRLAEHWLAADQQRQALDALLRAARSAQHQTLRLTEAAQWYERVAKLAEQLGDHGAAFDALAALLSTLVLLDRDRLDESLIDRLDAHATTAPQQARAVSMRAHALLHRGRFAECVAVAQRAADLARAAGDEELAAMSLADAAGAASLLGDSERAVRMLRPLLPWTLEHGSADTQILVLGHLGLSLDNIDHQAEAQPLHRRAIEAAIRARRFDEAVCGWGNMAVSQMDVGKPLAALEAIAQARAIGTAYDVLKGSSFTLNLSEGTASLAVRRYRAAFTAFETALADVAHHEVAAAAARVSRACLWIHLGQFARAQRELSLPELRSPLPAWIEARRQQMFGRCAWWTGNKADAARHWQAAAAGAPQDERAVLAAMIGLDHAQAQPTGPAMAAVRAVLVNAERLGHHGSALAARIRLAGLAHQLGDLDTALRMLSEMAQTPDDIEPNDLYSGERALATVRVLMAAGRPGDATLALTQAVEAIRRTAEVDVPSEFRDSFLNRNPVNRELLTLATRLA